MTDLVELTDAAFARQGPVHRLLGQHRPVQARIAHDFASFITDHRGDETTSVSLSEQRGGLGKTAAYTITLMLHLSLTGERAAYATFTRALRDSIMNAAPLFGRIVQQTLRSFDVIAKPVDVVEYHSPSAFVSPSKIAGIRSRIQHGRIPPEDLPEVLEFLDSYDASDGPCEFADLYALLPGLPCGWTELSLAMSSRDRGSDEWNTIKQRHNEARQPNTLMLLTHAMMLRSNLRSMHARSDKKRSFFADDDDEAVVKTLIVDEVDKLPSVASSTARVKLSRNEIISLLDEAREFLPRPLRIRPERILVQGLDDLGNAFQAVNFTYSQADPAAHAIANALENIGHGLTDLITAARQEDPLLADRLVLCRDEARALASFSHFKHPVMRVQAGRDILGQPDVTVTVEMAGGRSLISRLWRAESSPAFETVTLASALMTNLPPYHDRYDRFCRDVDLDRSKGDRVLTRPPLQPPYGGIRHVIVPDRLPALLPTDIAEPDLLRRTSLDGMANQITTAAGRRASTERIVVLFQSHAALQGVFERLSPGLQQRVVMRQRRRLVDAIDDFAQQSGGIWFGVEWEGINFVHPDTRRTLVDTLIITRIPLAPRDEFRVTRLGSAFGNNTRAESAALFEGVHAAYRKLYHGLLMGIRSPQDVIDELWILDPRWPLPASVYQRQPPLIIRSLAGPLFTQFDHVLDTFAVENWSKVDEDGTVRALITRSEAAD